MYQSSIKNAALTAANAGKPVTNVTGVKLTPEQVALESSNLSDTAVEIDESNSSEQAMKKEILWYAFGISVGVVLLFILAKKYGIIKF
jgi:hypothetical protein